MHQSWSGRYASLSADAVATPEVVSFRIEKDRAVVEREAGGGDREILELSLPCVIGAGKGLNEPRYPKLPAIMKARKKPVTEITLADLDMADAAGTVRVTRLSAAHERGAATLLEGSVTSMVDGLLCRLRTEAKVL